MSDFLWMNDDQMRARIRRIMPAELREVGIGLVEGTCASARLPRRGRPGDIRIGRATARGPHGLLEEVVRHECEHILDPHARRDHALALLGIVSAAIPMLVLLALMRPGGTADGSVLASIAVWAVAAPGVAFTSWVKRRQELRVDRRAAEAIGRPNAMMAMLEELRAEQRRRRGGQRIVELLGWMTHPSPQRRIDALANLRDG